MDEMTSVESEKKALIVSCTKMLQDAIALNEKNVEAKVRLGTLIHVFGSTFLKDFEMP